MLQCTSVYLTDEQWIRQNSVQLFKLSSLKFGWVLNKFRGWKEIMEGHHILWTSEWKGQNPAIQDIKIDFKWKIQKDESGRHSPGNIKINRRFVLQIKATTCRISRGWVRWYSLFNCRTKPTIVLKTWIARRKLLKLIIASSLPILKTLHCWRPVRHWLKWCWHSKDEDPLPD